MVLNRVKLWHYYYPPRLKDINGLKQIKNFGTNIYCPPRLKDINSPK